MTALGVSIHARLDHVRMLMNFPVHDDDGNVIDHIALITPEEARELLDMPFEDDAA